MTLESNPRSPASRYASPSDRQEAPFKTDSDRCALLDAERVRADTYVLLARLFRAPPDRALTDRLAECGDGGESGTALARAWTALATASRQADPVALDDEFHALFIGLGRGEVLPYASWYLSGFLHDKPLAQLRADLNRLGIERADNVSEPEDHVAAVFETMALLVDADAGIDHAGQKQFFEHHLRSWLPRFLADLRGAENADFYRRVADVAQGFFEFEESWLSMPQ